MKLTTNRLQGRARVERYKAAAAHAAAEHAQRFVVEGQGHNGEGLGGWDFFNGCAGWKGGVFLVDKL